MKKAPHFKHTGFIHWDYDIWSEDDIYGLQGLIALEDTKVGQGG